MFISYKNINKKLIVNADDFGYNKATDSAIIQLLQTQKILSLSVLVNGQNIHHAVEMINKIRNNNQQLFLKISLGLHFNLTQGRPLVSQIQNSVFCNSGYFLGKAQLYKKQLFFNEKQAELVGKQFRQQIKLFIKIFKRRPSHVDGHNHIHVIPSIAKQIGQIMRDYGIYYVRSPFQKIKQNGLLNQKFIQMSIKSKDIWKKYNIYSPIFCGLQGFGPKIQQQLQSNLKQLNKNNEQYKQLQLMCHPGNLTNQGSQWIKNIDRNKQKQYLLSQNYSKIFNNYVLSSYLDVKPKLSHKMNLLIYSKLQPGTGNQTTTKRYCRIFQSLGFQVYKRSAQDLVDFDSQVSDLSKFIINFKIKLIIGINVSRSASIIAKSVSKIGTPYILIVAGTDANITFPNQQSLKQLFSPLNQSLCIVSLSNSMTKITQKSLQTLKITKNVYTIVQSSILPQISHELEQFKDIKKPYILFPTSFRKVKAVDHVLKQLNKIIQIHNINVIIAGPILDQKYYLQVKDKIGKVNYIGTVNRQKYTYLLRQAMMLINTSDSEGMSCSILQAFDAQIPVLARKNQGNSQLIKDRHNGLLYNTPQQFYDNFLQIKDNIKLRQNLIKQSKKIFNQKYSQKRQIKQFKQILDKQFYSKISILDNKQIIIYCKDKVHPVSQINNKLFQQIKPNIKNNSTIIDLGCGSGIFSQYFINNCISNNLNVYLTDINEQITVNAFFNYLSNNSILKKCHSIFYKTNNMLQGLQNIHFDVILFNPPQTPFQLQQSRPDKNGGTNGRKYYQPIFEQLSKRKTSKLYMLQSYMIHPQIVNQLLQKYNLCINWKSSQQTHIIQKQSYDNMQQQLSQYILEHMQKGLAKIEFKQNKFYVPAVILQIVHKNNQ